MSENEENMQENFNRIRSSKRKRMPARARAGGNVDEILHYEPDENAGNNQQTENAQENKENIPNADGEECNKEPKSVITKKKVSFDESSMFSHSASVKASNNGSPGKSAVTSASVGTNVDGGPGVNAVTNANSGTSARAPTSASIASVSNNIEQSQGQRKKPKIVINGMPTRAHPDDILAIENDDGNEQESSDEAPTSSVMPNDNSQSATNEGSPSEDQDIHARRKKNKKKIHSKKERKEKTRSIPKIVGSTRTSSAEGRMRTTNDTAQVSESNGLRLRLNLNRVNGELTSVNGVNAGSEITRRSDVSPMGSNSDRGGGSMALGNATSRNPLRSAGSMRALQAPPLPRPVRTNDDNNELRNVDDVSVAGNAGIPLAVAPTEALNLNAQRGSKKRAQGAAPTPDVVRNSSTQSSHALRARTNKSHRATGVLSDLNANNVMPHSTSTVATQRDLNLNDSQASATNAANEPTSNQANAPTSPNTATSTPTMAPVNESVAQRAERLSGQLRSLALFVEDNDHPAYSELLHQHFDSLQTFYEYVATFWLNAVGFPGSGILERRSHADLDLIPNLCAYLARNGQRDENASYEERRNNTAVPLRTVAQATSAAAPSPNAALATTAGGPASDAAQNTACCVSQNSADNTGTTANQHSYYVSGNTSDTNVRVQIAYGSRERLRRERHSHGSSNAAHRASNRRTHSRSAPRLTSLPPNATTSRASRTNLAGELGYTAAYFNELTRSANRRERRSVNGPCFARSRYDRYCVDLLESLHASINQLGRPETLLGACAERNLSNPNQQAPGENIAATTSGNCKNNKVMPKTEKCQSATSAVQSTTHRSENAAHGAGAQRGNIANIAPQPTEHRRVESIPINDENTQTRVCASNPATESSGILHGRNTLMQPHSSAADEQLTEPDPTVSQEVTMDSYDNTIRMQSSYNVPGMERPLDTLIEITRDENNTTFVRHQVLPNRSLATYTFPAVTGSRLSSESRNRLTYANPAGSLHDPLYIDDTVVDSMHSYFISPLTSNYAEPLNQSSSSGMNNTADTANASSSQDGNTSDNTPDLKATKPPNSKEESTSTTHTQQPASSANPPPTANSAEHDARSTTGNIDQNIPSQQDAPTSERTTVSQRFIETVYTPFDPWPRLVYPSVHGHHRYAPYRHEPLRYVSSTVHTPLTSPGYLNAHTANAHRPSTRIDIHTALARETLNQTAQLGNLRAMSGRNTASQRRRPAETFTRTTAPAGVSPAPAATRDSTPRAPSAAASAPAAAPPPAAARNAEHNPRLRLYSLDYLDSDADLEELFLSNRRF